MAAELFCRKFKNSSYIKALKIFLSFIPIFITFCKIIVRSEELKEPYVSAKSAILICANSGSVIFKKNENMPLPMASTTKIMTAVLALEYIDACSNKEVEITDEMVRVEGTSMGLLPGDIVNIKSLIQGMMLCSGNDSANALSIAVSGNTDKFISLMNDKAKSIGMKNTKFSTPSGLDKDNHHSTAEDMAVLGAYAMENPEFSNIVSKKSAGIKFINPSKTVKLKNHNKLLSLYEGCIGIKTGFTKQAGRCLVSCAEKNNIKLICVTLNAPNDWDDHTNLYNYGFENSISKTFDDSNFKTQIPIENQNDKFAEAYCNSNFTKCFKKGDENKVIRKVEIQKYCKVPLQKGQILGKVIYSLDGKIIGENNIISATELKNEKPHKKGFFKSLRDFFGKIFKKHNK